MSADAALGLSQRPAMHGLVLARDCPSALLSAQDSRDGRQYWSAAVAARVDFGWAELGEGVEDREGRSDRSAASSALRCAIGAANDASRRVGRLLRPAEPPEHSLVRLPSHADLGLIRALQHLCVRTEIARDREDEGRRPSDEEELNCRPAARLSSAQ